MKSIICAISIALLSISCGAKDDKASYIEPELVDLVNEVSYDLSSRGVNVGNIAKQTIEFKVMNGTSVMGSCVMGKNFITINKNWFFSTDDSFFKKTIIAHELGHCAFGLGGHSNGGIMQEFLPFLGDYKDFYSTLMDNFAKDLIK